jgi:hypothetical protein
MLRPMVSRPVCLGKKAHIWGLRPDIYYSSTVTVLFFWGALSDERTVLSFVYAVGPHHSVFLLGSESLGTRDHILLSLTWDFPFRRLLRLSGSRWRYSNPPPHASLFLWRIGLFFYNHFARTEQKTSFSTISPLLLVYFFAVVTSLPSRCLAMEIYSDSTIAVFRRHAAIKSRFPSIIAIMWSALQQSLRVGAWTFYRPRGHIFNVRYLSLILQFQGRKFSDITRR